MAMHDRSSSREGERVGGSTVRGLETRAQGRWALWGRIVFLLLMLLLVAVGLLGLVGVRTTTATAHDGPWTVSVAHAAVARAGLDTPWEVRVSREGGFGKELVLAITGDYFDIFETQGFFPEPSDSTRDADTLYLTFRAPPGHTFVLSYDAYVQPASQLGREATLSVLDEGRRMARVHFSTRLLP